MQIEFTVLEKRGHLIPGLVHATAVDALDGDALKNNVFGKVERDGLGRKTKERNAPTSAHYVEGGANGIGMSRHFEHRVDAQTVGALHDDRLHILSRRIEY